MSDQVAFKAAVAGIKTEVSGGFKVTFEVPESELGAIQSLLNMREQELQIGVVKIG